MNFFLNQLAPTVPLSGSAERRIAFQHTSPLFDELTRLCDRAVVMLKGYSGPYQSNEVAAWLRTNFAPEFKKIVLKHLGLEVQGLEIFVDYNAYVYPTIADDTGRPLPIQDLIYQILYNSVGLGPAPEHQEAPAYVMRLLNLISQGISLNEGRFDDLARTHWKATIGIGTLFFTCEEDIANVVPFTGAEIASIIMHELGHAVTMAASSAMTYRQSELMKEAFAAMGSYEWTAAEIAKVTRAVADTAETLKRDNRGTSRMIVAIAKAGAKAAEFFARMQSTAKRVLPEPVLYLLMTALPTMSAWIHYMNIGASMSSYKWKVSDEVGTVSSKSHWERVADEFATRHGAGPDLASALIKMNAILAHGWGGKFDQSRVAPGRIIGELDGFLGVLNAILLIGTSPAFNGYDHELLRLQKMIDGHMAIFKNKNLPADIRNAWLERVRRAKAVTKEYQNLRFVRWRVAWARWFIDSYNPATFAEWIANGNIGADYYNLQEATTKFINNPLYYQAARLQSLTA